MFTKIRLTIRRWNNEGRMKPLLAPAHAVWRMLGHARGIALRPWVIRSMRQIPAVEGDETKLAELVRRIEGRFHGLVFSAQNHEELKSFLRMVNERKPKRVMELGTARGGTLLGLTRVAAADAVIVSLDLPGGKWGGGYPWWKIRMYKSMALPGQRVELIRGDSHAAESAEEVKRRLGGEPIDVLFIDGDHTYEGVKKDFEMYGPMVRAGGLIAFHDIAEHPAGEGGEVPRYWKELREGREVKELVEREGEGFGIGVVFVGKAGTK